jgi:CTP:phosphocholine cytidylyltransferase-like protein
MNIINLIPMAGEGQRFKDAGFTNPKPLIEVNGLPMIVRALKCLPKALKNILVVRTDTLDINEFKKKY